MRTGLAGQRLVLLIGWDQIGDGRVEVGNVAPSVSPTARYVANSSTLPWIVP